MTAAAQTVLVVDDQDVVREVATIALERAGYRVLATGSPTAAIQLALETSGIDLLLTAVVMPEMDGFELAGRLANTIPGLRVLYTSGYTDAGGEGAFLQKPFSPSQLVDKVGLMLAAACCGVRSAARLRPRTTTPVGSSSRRMRSCCFASHVSPRRPSVRSPTRWE